jgi:hypothetical protein
MVHSLAHFTGEGRLALAGCISNVERGGSVLQLLDPVALALAVTACSDSALKALVVI